MTSIVAACAAIPVLAPALVYPYVTFDRFVMFLKLAIIALLLAFIILLIESVERREEVGRWGCPHRQPPSPNRALGKALEPGGRLHVLAKAVLAWFLIATIADAAAWTAAHGGVGALLRLEFITIAAAAASFYIFYIPAILHRTVKMLECQPIPGPHLTAVVALTALTLFLPYIALTSIIENFIP
jgi:hypothetical protein